MVCGKAKRNSNKHVKLVERVSDVSDKGTQMKVFIDNEVKGNCDHTMEIVSEGDGDECKLYDHNFP